MSKLDEKFELYKSKLAEIEPNFDEELLKKITKSLVPAIYNADAEAIACSDKKEKERVRENFLKKKLGLDLPDEELDKAIEEICEKFGRSKKYRAVFYYLLVKKFNKEDFYA